jgi:repressor LexA
MTPRQQAILEFLRKRQAQSLPPPTIREIGAECDISSTSVVAYNLERLLNPGVIKWHREIARGIMLCDVPLGNAPLPAGLVEENTRLHQQLRVTEVQVKVLKNTLATERKRKRDVHLSVDLVAKNAELQLRLRTVEAQMEVLKNMLAAERQGKFFVSSEG